MSKKKGVGKLKRNLNLGDGIVYVVGFVIGTGIFLKPSVVITNMGSPGAALIMWIIGGVISLCSALTIAEIAVYIPKSGGLFSFLVDLYGDSIGFLYGWIETVISSPAGSAALAIATSTFASFFLPMTPLQIKLCSVFLTLIIVTIQVISTKISMSIQAVATIGKLIPLISVICFGLLNGQAHDINFNSLQGVTKIGGGTSAALLGVLWSYDGWINTCTLGEEMLDAEKNIPKSIITGLLITIGVYALFNVAIFNVLPASVVATSTSIGVDVSQKLFGHTGTSIITLGMFLACFAALNSQLISGVRLSYTMGKRKQLPFSKLLRHLNPRFDTPINSIIFQTVVTILFIIVGNFNMLTDLCIFIIWIFFTLGVIGIFILRKKYPRKKNAYHVPLFPFIPVIGILGGLYLIFSTIKDSFTNAMLGIGLGVLGLPIYVYCKKKESKE